MSLTSLSSSKMSDEKAVARRLFIEEKVRRIAKNDKDVPRLADCHSLLKGIAGDRQKHPFIFDSNFESGNLDMVVQVGPREFDLFMRVDSNTRGHHQWFFFKVKNQSNLGPVKFNILNFTKKSSLYLQGMRVNAKSMLATSEEVAKLQKPDEPPFIIPTLPNDGWEKTGTQIKYKLSKLSQSHNFPISGTNTSFGTHYTYPDAAFRRKKYYQVSFEYNFCRNDDETYFAYALPYPFSKLCSLLR